MPRTGRGGKVNGAAGKAYANRSDLNVSKTLPIEAAPDQTYGVAGEQRAAQRAIPLRTPNSMVPEVGETNGPAQQSPAPLGEQPTGSPGFAPVPTIDQPGSGPDAVRSFLDSTPAQGVGGVVSQNPDHTRLQNIAQSLADGPFSSNAVRDLAEFMRTMVM